MEDKTEITGILFFAFFIVAGAITGILLYHGCWWLSLLVGGVLGFFSAIIFSFLALLAIICLIVFILLLALMFLLLKNWAGAMKKFIKESTKRIKTALRII